MYAHIKKLRQTAEDHGIKFTMLRHKWTFDYWFFEYTPKRRNPAAFAAKYGNAKGKSWATSRARWCTGELKIKLMDRYFRELSKKYNLVTYVGIAADEVERLQRENQKQSGKRFPLAEWGWTEKDCL